MIHNVETTKELMFIKDLMEYFEVSQSTAYAIAKRKGFPSFNLGRKIAVRKTSLDKWIEKQEER